MLTKETDDKGRVTLGRKFANRMVIVREVDETEVVVTMVRVIPEREAWLYDNAKAKAAVLAGLEEASKGDFADAPGGVAADPLVDDVETTAEHEEVDA